MSRVQVHDRPFSIHVCNMHTNENRINQLTHKFSFYINFSNRAKDGNVKNESRNMAANCQTAFNLTPSQGPIT